MLCTRGGKKIINYHHQTMALTQHSRQSHTQVTLNISFGEKKNEWILNNKETIKNNKLGIQDRLIMTSRCVFKNTHRSWPALSFTWKYQLLYLGFSEAPGLCLRKNSSLFFCKISSAVRLWLPFSTIFWPEAEALSWSPLAGWAAGAGKD